MSPALTQSCALIKQFEGLRLSPYADAVGIPTIGWGNTRYQDGTKVTLDDDPLTQEQADDLLAYFVQKCLTEVQCLVTVPLTENQIAALTSFQYNTGALAKATVLEDLNTGNYQAAADELLKWNHAGGQVIGGLTRRRQEERTLFLTPDNDSEDT